MTVDEVIAQLTALRDADPEVGALDVETVQWVDDGDGDEGQETFYLNGPPRIVTRWYGERAVKWVEI